MSEARDRAAGDEWNGATWEGARREALRRWAALPLEEILAAQEEMAVLMDALGPRVGGVQEAEPDSR